MESNGSEQHRYYDQSKGLLGNYSGRQDFYASGSERRPTKRKFPTEGQGHAPFSSTHDRPFKSGNYGSYDPSVPPNGWLDCPAYGEAIDCIIPSKVPLGKYFNKHISTSKRYAPEHVIHQQRLLGREFGMVIDLTNTTRYYSLSAWSKEGIRHVKIRCKGKDAVPDDASVDKFVYEVSKFCSQGTQPQKFILVHCTHGHNRTGYMIAHFLIRSKSISVTEALDTFAKARPPGIYKDDYIDSLYRFYREKRPELVICPQTPEWKRSPSPDLSSDAVQDSRNESILLHNEGDHEMTNDDLLGVTVSSDQIRAMRQTCYQLLNVARGNQQFPGSHPVSLNRVNMQLLRQRYYYATWKADGTRYMMLITWDGCYLIDRNFSFRRIDMRFPCKQTYKGVHDQTHHYTLLDGEMVIDMDPKTRKQERRYLIYDVMAINQSSVVEMPFHERFKLLEKEVIEPRNLEREVLSKTTNPFYRYDLEPFSVRRKDFWLLSTVDKLLKKFIPKLPHEADGLIFQGWDDPYVPRTHEGLLKWKYLHMNSVDFLFEIGDDDRPILFLFDRGRKKLMEDCRVVFNDVPDPSSYSGKIIECSWDSEQKIWVFMRVRTDKSTPNDINTFRKVMRSITDNITEEVLFKEINEIINLPMYADRIQKDIRAHQNTVSSRRK